MKLVAELEGGEYLEDHFTAIQWRFASLSRWLRMAASARKRRKLREIAREVVEAERQGDY